MYGPNCIASEMQFIIYPCIWLKNQLKSHFKTVQLYVGINFKKGILKSKGYVLPLLKQELWCSKYTIFCNQLFLCGIVDYYYRFLPTESYEIVDMGLGDIEIPQYPTDTIQILLIRSHISPLNPKAMWINKYHSQ